VLTTINLNPHISTCFDSEELVSFSFLFPPQSMDSMIRWRDKRRNSVTNHNLELYLIYSYKYPMRMSSRSGICIQYLNRHVKCFALVIAFTMRYPNVSLRRYHTRSVFELSISFAWVHSKKRKRGIAHKVAPSRGAWPNYGRNFRYIHRITNPRFANGRSRA